MPKKRMQLTSAVDDRRSIVRFSWIGVIDPNEGIGYSEFRMNYKYTKSVKWIIALAPRLPSMISRIIPIIVITFLQLSGLQVEIKGQTTQLEIFNTVPDIEADMYISSELHYPLQCTLLGDSLLVIDPRANKVVIFNARTGAELGAFGRAGRGPGEFEFPIDIKADESSGSIWVLDQTRVIQFDRQGNYLQSFTKSVNSWTLGLLSDTELALAGTVNDRREAISVLSADGILLRNFGDEYAFLTTAESQARYGQSLVESAFGRLWRIGTMFNLLQEYSIDGDLIREGHVGLPALSEANDRNVKFANPPKVPGNNPKILVYSISASTDAIWIVTAGQFTKSGIGLEDMHVHRIDPTNRSQTTYIYEFGTLVDIEVLQDRDPMMLIGIDAQLQQIVWLRPATSNREAGAGPIGPSERR